MLNTIPTDVTPQDRPWWERVLDTTLDWLEVRVFDPIDEVVTPKLDSRTGKKSVNTPGPGYWQS